MAPAGFSGGDLFGIGLGDATSRSYEELFEVVQGNLSLSSDGEPLWIYCLSASGRPIPITVFNNGGSLVELGLDTYEENESALPDGFPEEGIINLQHFDNLLYSGPDDDSNITSTEDLKTAIRDPQNWKGSNNEQFQLSPSGSSSSCAILDVASSTVIVVATVIFVSTRL